MTPEEREVLLAFIVQPHVRPDLIAQAERAIAAGMRLRNIDRTSRPKTRAWIWFLRELRRWDAEDRAGRDEAELAKQGKFICAACNEVFQSAWTEEEARVEYEKRFGGAPEDTNAELVCDDCYEAAMKMHGIDVEPPKTR